MDSYLLTKNLIYRMTSPLCLPYTIFLIVMGAILYYKVLPIVSRLLSCGFAVRVRSYLLLYTDHSCNPLKMYSLDILFSTPAYWLEAAMLVGFFVLVNMFPCVRSSGPTAQSGMRSYLPTPVQAFTDALGREGTSMERCELRFCLACREKEVDCDCPPFMKQLVPVTKDGRLYAETAEEGEGEDGEGEESDEELMPECYVDNVEEEDEEDVGYNMAESEECVHQKLQCCPQQTKVRTHIRETASGRLVAVKEHCRHLPGRQKHSGSPTLHGRGEQTRQPKRAAPARRGLYR